MDKFKNFSTKYVKDLNKAAMGFYAHVEVQQHVNGTVVKIESINRYSAIKLTKTRINTTTGKVQHWHPTSLWVDADHFYKVVCK
ncbi:hypothetical protein [Salmonella enterica]|uniref:hypothetical protein n=1 Tax=Salmonella enterica TaxID=28901 RepID=UPI00069AD4E6|nr:hypothetical protein [Salmonella enterica]